MPGVVIDLDNTDLRASRDIKSRGFTTVDTLPDTHAASLEFTLSGTVHDAAGNTVSRNIQFFRFRDLAVAIAEAMSDPIDGTYSVTLNGNKNERYIAIAQGDVELGENSQIFDLLSDVTPPPVSLININIPLSYQAVFSGFITIAGSLPVTWKFTGANAVELVVSGANPVDVYYASSGLTFPVNIQMFCADADSVTAVSLFYQGIGGEVPPIDIFRNLLSFDCGMNSLTGPIPDLSANLELTSFKCNNNGLTGSIPDLSANQQLSTFECYTNSLTGSIPILSSTIRLDIFNCSDNSLTGSIPDLSANQQLSTFRCSNNGLTGSIPTLNGAAQSFYFFDCSNNYLTGSIPILNVDLVSFFCSSNALTGNIPDLSAIRLSTFGCSSNNLTGWVGGSVGIDLTQADFSYNMLPQATIDALLAAFDTAGAINGYLNLEGTGNARPSSVGLSSRSNLVAKGWVVMTNVVLWDDVTPETVVSADGLAVTMSVVNISAIAMSTRIRNTGKFYLEYLLGIASTAVGMSPVGDATAVSATGLLGVGSTWAFIPSGILLHFNAGRTYAGFAAGDVIGVAVDMDAGTMFFSVNGVWVEGSNPVTGVLPAFTDVSGELRPAIQLSQDTVLYYGKFTLDSMVYGPPEGYVAFDS